MTIHELRERLADIITSARPPLSESEFIYELSTIVARHEQKIAEMWQSIGQLEIEIRDMKKRGAK